MAVTLDDRRTVFLDKDGTLIDDLPYNVDPRRVRFAPGAREAVRLLSDAGYRLIVAIRYNTQRVYVRDFMTHEEYNKQLWKRRH